MDKICQKSSKVVQNIKIKPPNQFHMIYENPKKGLEVRKNLKIEMKEAEVYPDITNNPDCQVQLWTFLRLLMIIENPSFT